MAFCRYPSELCVSLTLWHLLAPLRGGRLPRPFPHALTRFDVSVLGLPYLPQKRVLRQLTATGKGSVVLFRHCG